MKLSNSHPRLALLSTAAIAALLSFSVASRCPAQISEFRATLSELKNSWEAEQKAIKKIKELGGWVKLEDCVPSKWHTQIPKGRREFVVEVNMVYHEGEGGRQDNDNRSDECLEAIGKFTQVKRIYLKETQASDEKLKHLADLKQVERFYIWDAKTITDQGLKHLQKYRKLQNVHISHSQITSKGIAHLSNSNSITKLSLQGNRFTNEIFKVAARFKKLETLWVGLGENTIDNDGLQEITALRNLKTLGIQRIHATDAGLKPIYKLPKLQKVYLSGTQLSKDAIQELKDHVAKNAEK